MEALAALAEAPAAMADTPLPDAQRTAPARVIVVGNEKGGSGKSTVAINLIVGLLRSGLTVASIDIDARQGTLTRYLANRRTYAGRRGIALPMPAHVAVLPSDSDSRNAAEADERARLATVMEELAGAHDAIVVDTPGRSDHLTRLMHSYADTLITPINDSHIDLDLIGTVDPETRKVIRPSVYSELVWEQRKERARWNRRPIDWILMRNRIRQTDTRNAREIEQIVNSLSRRFAFRVAPGFGERVIFREMFPNGLTLLDLREARIDTPLTLSHVAARNEIRILLDMIGVRLPD